MLRAPVLHARMMGPTNTALITFSGTHVPHYVRMYGAELRCHIYRPRQQVCSVCLSMGHRADVCPMPDKPRCAACGISNPPKEHECTPKCIHCDAAHPATDPRCPSRQLPAHNKSHVLREHNKRKEQRPPPGPAQGQLGSTTQQGAQQNPTQSAKTPGSSAENPWTRGRSRTRGSPGDRLQTDRSRSAGGSKGRTPSHGRSRDRGHNKKGSDKKEQARLAALRMGSGSRTFDERFPCFLTTGNSINRRNSESGIDRDQFLQDPVRSSHVIDSESFGPPGPPH